MDTSKLISRAQAAQLLRVDPQTLDRWRRTKFLPSVLVGKRYLFDPAEVRAKIQPQRN